jgi:GxxExxY protein
MNATSLPPIYADERGLKHRELTEKLIRIFFDIYNELGHGFLESVYQKAFAVSLAEKNIFFEQQVAVPVWYHGHQIGDFRADLLVDRKVILELKVGRAMDSAWEKQLLNYLRATDIEVGILFNFGPKAEFRRFAFENERKIRVHPRLSAEKEVAF